MPGQRAEAPSDPLQWRPQVPMQTRRAREIRDPIVEPLWSGVRVIAHFERADADDRGRLTLVDADGEDASSFDPALTDDLAGSIMAFDAVIDGILSQQATRTGEGAAIVHHGEISPSFLLLPREPGIDVQRPNRGDLGVVAFVGVDLLRIDGESLLDLPLLERKRLLESTIIQGDRVRVSPFTRPPMEPWVASFKAAGFKGAILKAANGRYAPGAEAADWTTITRLNPRR